MTVSQRLSAGWQEPVLARVADIYRASERTYKKVAANVVWMFAYFTKRGIEEWPDVNPDITLEWCWAGTRSRDGSRNDPSASTASNRQWTARLVFEVVAALGAEVDPNTAAGETIKRDDPDASARPLTDDELRRICAYADPGAKPSRRSAAFALSKSGGSAAEAAAVRIRDIDLDAGTVTFSGPSARVCALDEWSAQTIARYLRANPPTSPEQRLCVTARTFGERATESVNAQLWKVISEAGFARRADISGRSLRLTAARRVLESDGIEAAARLLGSPSLDNTAKALGYSWQEHTASQPLGYGRRGSTIPQSAVDESDAASLPEAAQDGNAVTSGDGDG